MEGNTVDVVNVKEELQIVDCGGLYLENHAPLTGVLDVDDDDDTATSSGTLPKRFKRDTTKLVSERVHSGTHIPEGGMLMSRFIDVKQENTDDLCDVLYTDIYQDSSVDPLAGVPDHQNVVTAPAAAQQPPEMEVTHVVNVEEIREKDGAVELPVKERDGSVAGARSSQVYYHDGYSYYQYHVSSNVVNLKCARINSCMKCWGQATMQRYRKETFKIVNSHNHEPDAVVGNKHYFTTDIIDRCSSELTSFPIIYQEVAKEYPPEVSADVTYASLLATMHRSRTITQPLTPTSLYKVGKVLTACQKNYPRLLLQSDASPFYHGTVGSGKEEGHSTVFVSNKLAQFLASFSDLQMDGSFKIVPSFPPVGHLFTISAFHAGHVFPFVYVLMEQRNTKAYVAVLNYIKKMLPTIQPKRVVCDFDASLQGAIRLCFPSTEMYGCWFNFAEAVCRKARTSFSRKTLQKCPQRRKAVKMMLVLPFLPIQTIVKGYEYIVEFSHINKILRFMCTFLDEFRETWIEKIGHHHLSVYKMPWRASQAKENYCSELLEYFNVDHINIWQFLGRLQELERKHAERLAEAGMSPASDDPPLYVEHKCVQESLDCVTREKDNRRVGWFLETVSGHIQSVYHRYMELLPDPECEEEFPQPSAGLLTFDLNTVQALSMQENCHSQSTAQQS